MGVRVHDKAAEQTAELDPAEAQARWLGGEVALADDSVRVKRGVQTGSVASTNLARALAEGWELSDDDEAAALTLRREESDAGSMALGTLERALAGASLGLSSVAEEALGVDPERMAARAQELGGLGEAAELAGAIVPGLFSGGAGTAASLGRAGAARSLGRGALRLATAPARLATRAGAATERALAGRTGSTAVSLAGRGLVEGVAFGEGQVIDESVLGGHEITAELLLAEGGTAALLGAGGGALLPGIAKVGAGLVKAPIRGVQTVLGRSRGLAGSSHELAQAVAGSSLLDDLVLAQNRAFGDEAAAGRVLQAMREDSKLVDDVFRNEKAVTEGIATDVQRAWNLVDDKADEVLAGAYSLKPAQLRKAIARELDDVSPRETARFVGTLREELGQARAYNIDAPGSYLRPELDRLEQAITRATFELGDGVDSAHAMVTLGKLRRQIGETVTNTGGWGKRIAGVSDAAWETNRKARDLYGKVRERLRDDQWWGGGAKLQADVDDTIAAFHGARDKFREVHRGGYGGGIAGQAGEMSADQAIKLVRSWGRFGGAAKANALEELLDHKLAQLNTARKHFDLDETQLAKIDEARAGVEEIKRALGKNAKRAAIADDIRVLRDEQTDKSPTSTIASTMGSAVLGSLGLAAGGPIGAAAGILAGAVTRPYTTMKTLARARTIGAIQARAGGTEKRLQRLIDGAVERVRGATGAARSAAKTATAAAAVRTRTQRRERAEQARERAAFYATNPTAIGEQTKVALYDLDEHAPGVASAVRQYTQIASMYLASKAPQVTRNPFTGEPAAIDPIELEQFEDRVEALDDPIGTLERGMSDNSLSSAHVDAIRSVYPKMFEQAQRDIVASVLEVAGKGDAVPYRLRVQLGMMFDLPLDPSLQGGSLLRTHGAFATQPEPRMPPPSNGRPGMISKVGQLETATQKIEGGKSA